MSTPATVPIFDPQGTVRDVPYEQMRDAVQAGGTPAVRFKDSQGVPRYVPANRTSEAVQAGGTIQPIADQDVKHPGFWQTVAEDFVGAAHAVAPVPSALADVATGGSFKDSAVNLLHALVPSLRSGEMAQQLPAQDAQRKAAGYSLPYRAAAPIAQAAGANVPGMEQSAATGDVAGVYGHLAAAEAPLVTGEAASAAAPALAPFGERLAARLPESEAVSRVGQFVAKSATDVASDIPVVRQLAKVKSNWDATAPKPTFPTAPLGPEAPPPEVLQARGLANGAQPAVDPAAGLGQIKLGQTKVAQPVPPAVPAAQEPAAIPSAAASPAAVPPAPTATPQTAKATLTDLQQQIKDSLGGKTAYEMAGGKPLQDGVSLKNQRPQTNLQQQIKDAVPSAAKQTPKAPVTDLQAQIADAGKPPLPADFTATPDSSLLRGYKYDPAKQQFSAILNSGDSYTHGEVTPDQVKAFEAADSQGSAWTKKIKQGAGSVLVEKNGLPFKPIGARTVVVDPATGTREFSDVIAAKQNATQTAPAPQAKAAPPAGEGDLTSLLQQSLEQVPAAKGGVFTTAAPADLGQRWGVDESSIADTDANLRGLNAQQSQAYIDKLAKSYKSGTPVEPVMETRDAENNIISVDGRHRALAAQKAGIERIPVIVRRLQSTSGAVQ